MKPTSSFKSDKSIDQAVIVLPPSTVIMRNILTCRICHSKPMWVSAVQMILMQYQLIYTILSKKRGQE